jgi:hypothetical protein
MNLVDKLHEHAKDTTKSVAATYRDTNSDDPLHERISNTATFALASYLYFGTLRPSVQYQKADELDLDDPTTFTKHGAWTGLGLGTSLYTIPSLLEATGHDAEATTIGFIAGGTYSIANDTFRLATAYGLGKANMGLGPRAHATDITNELIKNWTDIKIGIDLYKEQLNERITTTYQTATAFIDTTNH